MSLPLYPIDDLLPHARPMILLDRVAGREDDGIVTELLVRPGLPFTPWHITQSKVVRTDRSHR